MKEKIIALLTAKFAGVRKDGLEQLARAMALQAAGEDEATALVEKLTEAQVNDFVKEYRSEVDREATEAHKKFEANLKKRYDFVERKTSDKKEDEPAPTGGEPADMAAMIKAAVEAAVKPFQTELSVFKQSEVAKSRLQTLTEKLDGCKDETLKAKALKDFARMKFDTDEEFNEYLTETETDISTANQNLADSALGAQGRPLFTQKNEKGVSSGVSQFIESQKTDNANPLSGKEV